jgi:MinD-like ATPase involved in chromosome partitioning or flagellar assembly
MLRIAIIELNAEGRSRLNDHIQNLINSEVREIELLPRISIIPALFEEIGLIGCPDIVIVGPGVVERDVSIIRNIREQSPSSSILALLLSGMQTLALVEQVARMGADDTITEKTSADELFRKIVLLSRRTPKKDGGKLVLVDSGKGGLGVTTIAAGLGEALLDCGKKVSLIDLDSDSQDLSRFLQTRPYINEPLQLLLEQKRPATEEMVRQALVNVWADEYNLLCMPPAPDEDRNADMRAIHARVWVSILELVETMSDVTIVDVGNARGPVLRTLYRVADAVIFVVSNDPASIFAAADKVVKARGWMSADSELFIVNNSPNPNGLSTSILTEELCAATKIKPEMFIADLGYDAAAAKWPASGSTPFAICKPRTRASILRIASKLFADIQIDSGTATAARFAWVDDLAMRVFGRPLFRGSEKQKGVVAALPNRAGKALPAPSELDSQHSGESLDSSSESVAAEPRSAVPQGSHQSGATKIAAINSKQKVPQLVQAEESRNEAPKKKLVSGVVFK